MVILELIHAHTPDLVEGLCLLDSKPIQASLAPLVIHSACMNCMAPAGYAAF